MIGGADPYELAPSSWINDNLESLPSIAYPDIVIYLVFSPSPYTMEDIKSYKSLEAYNQMVCGWVREMLYQVTTRLSSTMANVSSQPGVSALAESHGSDSAASASGQEKNWCFCGQVEFGKIILCDNAKCHIKWFHYSCINVKVAPKGKW